MNQRHSVSHGIDGGVQNQNLIGSYINLTFGREGLWVRLSKVTFAVHAEVHTVEAELS